MSDHSFQAANIHNISAIVHAPEEDSDEEIVNSLPTPSLPRFYFSPTNQSFLPQTIFSRNHIVKMETAV